MTRSSFVALRQQKAPDYPYSEVSGQVCSELLPSHPTWWSGTLIACQKYENTRRVAAVKWTHWPANGLVESAGTSRRLTITIATYLSYTVSVFPRFPPLGLV